MLVSDIFTQIQDHGFTDLTNPQLFFMLNDVIQDFCSLEPWPFLEKTVTTTFTVSSAIQFAATTDIKQVLMLNNTTTLVNIIPERADTVLKTYGVYSPNLVGTPTLYFTDG